MLEQQAVDGNFSNNIFFSDEAHFMLVGYVNKQNCRIWDSQNSQVIIDADVMAAHPQKVTVWCVLWSELVIEPFFFENADATAVTVNSKCYGHMITEIFCLLLKNATWRICDSNKTVPHAT